MSQCSEAAADKANYSEKYKQSETTTKKFISSAGASIETAKNVSVRNFFNLLFNQIRSVFNGDIVIQSDICLTPNLKMILQK